MAQRKPLSVCEILRKIVNDAFLACAKAVCLRRKLRTEVASFDDGSIHHLTFSLLNFPPSGGSDQKQQFSLRKCLCERTEAIVAVVCAKAWALVNEARQASGRSLGSSG